MGFLGVRRCGVATLALAVCLVVSPALAHTFTAPSQVRASTAGQFRFQATFTAGPGSATLSSDSWFAISNVTPGGVIGEGDCEFTLPEGGTTQIDVNASLIDPARPGRVRAILNVCGPNGTQSFTALTDILPTTPVPLAPGGVRPLIGLGLLLLGLCAARARRRAPAAAV